MQSRKSAISEIRSFNRFYTKILGLLNHGFLNSSFSLTEARILLEISRMDRCTAYELGNRLSVDRSYMSRILKRFERDGLIYREKSEHDKRIHFISLTGKGTAEMEKLDGASDEQVSSMLRSLTDEEVSRILEAMHLIRLKLSDEVSHAVIREFRDDDMDYVLNRHKTLYAEEYGLSPLFAGNVEKMIPGFFQHCDRSCECMWIAEADGKPVGSIAIVDAGQSTAQLRYFLLEPAARGMGLGKRLIDCALEFAKNVGYQHVFLETISALKTARGIYRNRGFRMTEVHENPEWGKGTLEERWDIDLVSLQKGGKEGV